MYIVVRGALFDIASWQSHDDNHTSDTSNRRFSAGVPMRNKPLSLAEVCHQLLACAMMRNIVGTRAEASVAEQNHNCSPILSVLWLASPGICVVHRCSAFNVFFMVVVYLFSHLAVDPNLLFTNQKSCFTKFHLAVFPLNLIGLEQISS